MTLTGVATSALTGQIMHYRSGRQSLWQQVVRNALASTTYYRRATGFFSSSVFDVDLATWCAFFARSGHAEFVASPILSHGDITAFHRGLFHPHSLLPVTASALPSWCRVGRSGESSGQRLLAWATAHRLLDVWIAVPQDLSGVAHGLYHEKFCLFYSTGSTLAMTGSANESRSGYVSNFERLEGFSNSTSVAVVAQLAREFESLKTNNTPGLRVLPLSRAFAENILRARLVAPPDSENINLSAPPTPPSTPEIIRWPHAMDLRPYQEERVQAWLDAGGTGIFPVATGAGKTLMALGCLARVYDKCGPPLVAIVVVPYIVLVDQWTRQMRLIGMNPIRCCEDRAEWESLLRAAIYRANTGKRPLLSVVVTTATFASPAFQDCLRSLDCRTVLVADEVHNLGARQLRDVLPNRIPLRLGLSATPERFMDADGTKAIEEYFGPRLPPFTLEDALRWSPPILTPYYYYPVVVGLEDDETQEYLELTRKLARFLRDPKTENLSNEALHLLLKRARLVASARQKIPALKARLCPYLHARHTLIYCGDGSVELRDSVANDPIETRQVDQVVRMLEIELRMSARPFTHRESRDQRQHALRDFTEGRTQALVAIRCLDEGVDVPMIQRAFILASSTNPRQFIQRRGRVLRRAEGKEHAEIYDFIVRPPASHYLTASENQTMHSLALKELERALEFARCARNHYQALEVLSEFERRHRAALLSSPAGT